MPNVNVVEIQHDSASRSYQNSVDDEQRAKSLLPKTLTLDNRTEEKAMSTVQNISTTSSGSRSSHRRPAECRGDLKTGFSLLVTQLKNQDPLNPLTTPRSRRKWRS